MRFYEYIDCRLPDKRFLVIIPSLLCIFGSISLLIHIRVSQSIAGYAIAEYEQQVLELEKHFRDLTLELSVLKRPERIQKLAHDWLKMRNSYD